MPWTVRITVNIVSGDAAQTLFSARRRARVEVASSPIEIEGTWVIQLSELIDGEMATSIEFRAPDASRWLSIDRALCREMAYIVALRRQIRERREVDSDTLRAGRTLHAMSPRDHALVAELDFLAYRLERRPSDRPALLRDILAIIDHAGLRESLDGAAARRALMEQVAPASTVALVHALAIRESDLSDEVAVALNDVRALASADLEAHVARAFYERRAFPMPTVEPCRFHLCDGTASEALSFAARAEREHSDARARSGVRSVEPWTDPMIGGGAALAGRSLSSVLVDDRGRWRRDPVRTIAQTARELADVRNAGFGDPLEFVPPDERVPVAALRFWEDSVAALGPVVYGHATVRQARDGGMRIELRSGTPSHVRYVKIDGIVTIATGFPPERIVGLPVGSRAERLPLTLPGVFDEISERIQLYASSHGDALVVRDSLSTLTCYEWEDAEAVLSAIPVSLRGSLPDQPRVRYLIDFLKAAQNWSAVYKAHPGRLFLADEISDESLGEAMQADLGDHWTILGLGGTAVSAAEVILQYDPTAHIRIIGPEFTDGLRDNGQLRMLESAHGSRIELADGHTVLRLHNGAGEFRVYSRLRSGDEVSHGCKRVVVALGRPGRIPAPIETIVLEAKRASRTPRFLPLIDAEGYYLGYEVIVYGTNFHVIGAASRYLPRDIMLAVDADRLQKLVEIASDRDAPPETGGFAGGFASSTMQAARYFRWRRAGMPSP